MLVWLSELADREADSATDENDVERLVRIRDRLFNEASRGLLVEVASELHCDAIADLACEETSPKRRRSLLRDR